MPVISNNDSQFLSVLDSIKTDIGRLTELDLIAPENGIELDGHIRRITEKIKQDQSESKTLRLGVIGLVKAGKSSFLNALLFDGNDILPKAATPMTAALTKICYADKKSVRVHFYEEYDWKRIQAFDTEYSKCVDAKLSELRAEWDEEYGSKNRSAAKQDPDGKDKSHGTGLFREFSSKRGESTPPPPTRADAEQAIAQEGVLEDLRAAHEVVEMAKEQNLAVAKYLGTTVEIDFSQLDLYVGAKGKYTPIVRDLELMYQDDGLRNIEVVDTPGLNDPIASRGKRTEEYLIHCDAILILSKVSQFLPQSDVELIATKLPESSIREAYIIGSQLDAGILQFQVSKRPDLATAWNGSLDTYEAQKNAVIRDVMGASSEGQELLRKLDRAPSYFISSLMYGIGRKLEKHKPLNPEEKHIYDTYQMRFPDFSKCLQTPEDFIDFSQIETVRNEVYEKIRQNKEQILQERLRAFIPGQAAVLIKLLEGYAQELRSNLQELETTDIEQLSRKKSRIEHELNGIRGKISGIFSSHAVRYRRELNDCLLLIAQSRNDVDKISITKKTVPHTYTTGHLWNKQTHKYDELIPQASIADVEQSIFAYGVKAQSILNERLHRASQYDKLREEIISAIQGAYDLSDEDFDRDMILRPVETLLNKLTIPEVSFSFQKRIEDKLNKAYPLGYAQNDEIHQLNKLYQDLLQSVLAEDLKPKIDEMAEEIETKMNLYAGTFVDQISGEIGANLDRIQSQLKDREANVARYQEAIRNITEAKKRVMNFS